MISGTNVATDFVELPSQLYEHWLEQPEVLRRFARHYRTGAPMPEDLLRAAASRRAPSTRASPRSNMSPRRWSISICMRCTAPECDRRQRLRADGARRASACRTRSPCATGRRISSISSPAAAMRRPITATCGRRCSTPTPSRRSRRPATSSIRQPRSGCATRSMPPAARAIRPRPTRPSAAGCRAREALLRKRGLAETAVAN